MHDLVTFLFAGLPSLKYTSICCWGGQRERYMNRIDVKIQPVSHKTTLASRGPCWSNLSRQTKEAAEQSGKIETAAPPRPSRRERRQKSTESFSGFRSHRKATHAKSILSTCGGRGLRDRARAMARPRSVRQPRAADRPGREELPRSTHKPGLVSHTLAAEAPQGRGGDEAEWLLEAVKSLAQKLLSHSRASVSECFSLGGFCTKRY